MAALTFGQPVQFFPAPLAAVEPGHAPQGFQGRRHADPAAPDKGDPPLPRPLLAFVSGYDDDGIVDLMVVDAGGGTWPMTDVEPWDGSGEPPDTDYYMLLGAAPGAERSSPSPTKPSGAENSRPSTGSPAPTQAGASFKR